jgi:hypothetical protein
MRSFWENASSDKTTKRAKTRSLCIGVISWKLTQPIIQTKNDACTYKLRHRCWSPNWNEPQTDSGTPRFGNRFGESMFRFGESMFRFGDPRSDMGSPFWMPFQFGDKTIKSQIGTNPKPILVSDWTIPKPILGSLFWYGDVLIPISVRGSPNRFGDSLWFASPFRFGDPRFCLGIPKPIWGSPN